MHNGAVEKASASPTGVISLALLDEPGISLHPLAQRDLSAFFDSLAETNQLILRAIPRSSWMPTVLTARERSMLEKMEPARSRQTCARMTETLRNAELGTPCTPHWD